MRWAGCSWSALDEVLSPRWTRELNACPLREGADAIVVDMHAEATSEKMAMGHFCDGRASLVVGGHQHIPTADAQILPGGTAFQADAGACADYDSVIGMDKYRAACSASSASSADQPLFARDLAPRPCAGCSWADRGQWPRQPHRTGAEWADGTFFFAADRLRGAKPEVRLIWMRRYFCHGASSWPAHIAILGLGEDEIDLPLRSAARESIGAGTHLPIFVSARVPFLLLVGKMDGVLHRDKSYFRIIDGLYRCTDHLPVTTVYSLRLGWALHHCVPARP